MSVKNTPQRRKATHIDQLCLSLGDTLLGTPDNDLVRLGDVPPAFTRFRVVTRENYLNVILILETDDVFATLTNERRVVLTRYLQDLSGFIGLGSEDFSVGPLENYQSTHEFISLRNNATLGLLDILLATGDLPNQVSLCSHENSATELTLTLTFCPTGAFFFLPESLSSWSSEKSTLTPSESRILLTPAPWAPTIRATNSWPISNSVDCPNVHQRMREGSEAVREWRCRSGGCTHIAVHDLIVLGGLDDLLDLLHSTVDVGTDAANNDDILSVGIASVLAELDGQRIVFADNPAQYWGQLKAAF